MMWVRRPRTKGHGAAAAQYFREACLQLARPPTRGADSLACADCSSVLDNVEEDYDEPVLTIEGLLTADSSATTLTLTPTPTPRGENEEGSQIYADAVALEKVFRAQHKNAAAWRAAHETTSEVPPPAAPRSHAGADEDRSKRRRVDTVAIADGSVSTAVSRAAAVRSTSSSTTTQQALTKFDKYDVQRSAWDAVRNATEHEAAGTKRKSEARVLSELFLELPSHDDLPDYFETIKKPMDLRMIRERIDEKQYRRWENFERDMLLMFENARTYNVEGSQIYADAVALEKVFRAQHKTVQGLANGHAQTSPLRNPIDSKCAACNGAHRAHTCGKSSEAKRKR